MPVRLDLAKTVAAVFAACGNEGGGDAGPAEPEPATSPTTAFEVPSHQAATMALSATSAEAVTARSVAVAESLRWVGFVRATDLDRVSPINPVYGYACSGGSHKVSWTPPTPPHARQRAHHRPGPTMELTAVRTPADEGGYVALDPETGTTTQGETVEEAVANLREATALYLSEFPIASLGHPAVTTFSLPEHAQAASGLRR